jgi:hypothetical protein
MSQDCELDLTHILSERNLAGRQMVPPCKAHVLVAGIADDDLGKTPCMILKLQILAATVPASVGMTFEEKIYLSEKAMQRAALVAYRLGLITKNDFGKKRRINWAAAKGRQLVVEVIEEEYEKQDGSKGKKSKVAFAGFWDVNHPDVADVPKDASMTNCPTTGQSAAGASAEDDFSDL